MAWSLAIMVTWDETQDYINHSNHFQKMIVSFFVIHWAFSNLCNFMRDLSKMTSFTHLYSLINFKIIFTVHQFQNSMDWFHFAVAHNGITLFPNGWSENFTLQGKRVSLNGKWYEEESFTMMLMLLDLISSYYSSMIKIYCKLWAEITLMHHTTIGFQDHKHQYCSIFV